MLMQEGLLDFLGDLFGKLVGFFTGAADKGKSQGQAMVSDGNARFKELAKKYDQDITWEDVDWKNDKHRRLVFEATVDWFRPDAVDDQVQLLEAAAKIKDWTPADDSDEAAKKWEEEYGEAAAGLWKVLGEDLECTKFLADIGATYFDGSVTKGQAAMSSGNPAEAAQFIVASAEASLGYVKDAIKVKTPGAEEGLSAVKAFGKAGQAVAEAIAASGKEQQKESLELRKLINTLVHQVIKG